MDVELPIPKFVEYNEVCSESAGGKILFATDDYFATAENMISDTDPIFIADKYTECGKWMDGWETRRKRKPGHDWCIVKIGAKCIIHGIEVDTAFFTGNYAPKYSLQAACLTPEEEALIPPRKNIMGSACSAKDMQQMLPLHTDHWQEIVPKTNLRPGYEATRHNYQKVISEEAFTHLRINIYPDGGIARLRVFGVTQPTIGHVTAMPDDTHMIDIISMKNGGVCQAYSNAHYGHPRNLIKPERGLNMGDGWETARRLDRPEVIQLNEDGTLKVPGSEWAIFKAGFTGTISKICVDTNHFKGNYPDNVKIEGALLDTPDWSESVAQKVKWFNVLPASKLTAHSEHWFDCYSPNLVSHVRITMAPDGGISRVRVYSGDAL